MQPQLIPQQSQGSSAGGVAAKVVGGALLVPAIVLTVQTLIVPTVQTIRSSMRSESLVRGAGSPAGSDNFAKLFEDPRLWSALWFSLSLVVGPIIVAVVVAPLVAAALNWAGGWARWTARIALSLPLVVFSPVAVAIAWQRAFRDDPSSFADLADVDLAGGTLRWAILTVAYGLLVAVGVTIFLPVFRAREQRRPMWPALFTTAGVVVLGLLAVGLQLFTIPLVITAGGPENRTQTLVGLLFDSGFRIADVGRGAAVGTILLALLAVLGVAAVLVIILTRLRVSLLPLRHKQSPPAQRTSVLPAAPAVPPAGRNPGAIVLAALVLVAVAVVIVVNASPWFDALSGSDPATPPGTQSRTWSSAAFGAVVSVGVAYLAALGISGLRPLGRHSEWLLLPFAPWLFVGVAPLSISLFISLKDRGEVDTDNALRPPILISILALMILAMLCRGQSERWQREVTAGAPAGSSFVRAVLLPTLPLAALLFVAVLFVNAQDLLWPLLVASSPEHGTAPLMLYLVVSGGQPADIAVASTTPLLAIVLGFLVVVAVQLLHLDRLVAATGSAGSVGSSGYVGPHEVPQPLGHPHDEE